MRNALRPVCSAAINVEPLPPKRSRTFSPGLDEYSIARDANSTGFSVRWIIDCGLTFLTDQTSVALLGAEELMGGVFFPAVEAPLVVTHEVLARQHRMLLHPDDGLGEVQARGLQHWGVVGAIGVAAPDVGSASREQHAGQIAKPGVQQALKFLVGDKVVGQGPVFGLQLPGCPLRFLGVAGEIQRLVMGCLERTEACRDRIIRAWFDADIIWRIDVDQVDVGAIEQTIHILGLA